MLVSNRFNNKIDDDYNTFTQASFSRVVKYCQVTVTLQLLKMTLESVETSSKIFISTINFIVKSVGN